MEGGLVRQSAEGRVDAGRADSVARFFSRQTIIGAFVAVIALIFHATGSTGPGAATTNMSVFVLSILIAQVTMPHRHLRQLLSAPSHTTRYVANPQLATTWQRRRDDPQRVRVFGYTVSPQSSIATSWSTRRSRVAGSLASVIRKRIA
ncbi:MAG: hypothetical protein WB807_00475 [Candidatus Dormiibacterota bacterium]